MKSFTKLCALSLAGLLSIGTLAACGGENGDSTTIRFVASGMVQEYAALQQLVNTYNDSQGKEDGVNVKISYKDSDSYANFIRTTQTGKTAADIFYLDDRVFKSYVIQGIAANLTELQETTGITLDLAEQYPNGNSRYHYDVETNTSNDDDPLYGVVRAVSPTIIYYNQSAFEKVGIICVSVPEEEITDEYVTKFNADLAAKGYEFASFTKEYLKRGFVRSTMIDSSEGNYQNTSYSWEQPQQGEAMVFNNRIPMSWDEVEDLGKILTKEYNSASPTDHGFYTWWWFYYGFSVGGDCIEDVTGDGDWVFTLKDAVHNYIVADDYVGTITVGEHEYAAGDLISYLDRVEIPEAKREYILQNSSDLDDSYLTSEVLDLAAQGTLIQLPSEREAFLRYVMLAQTKGTAAEQYYNLPALGISPQPKNVTGGSGNTDQFTNGDVAMLVHMSDDLLSIQDDIATAGDKKFDWNVAPLPVYKEYEDGGAVRIHGVQAGASDSNAFCINPKTTLEKQTAAMKFLKYLCTKEAQDVVAATGFTLPNRPDSVPAYIASNPDRNLAVIAEAAIYQTPGDWWYMADRDWINNNWANDLNSNVRNGRMSIEAFFENFPASQQALNMYNPKYKN